LKTRLVASSITDARVSARQDDAELVTLVNPRDCPIGSGGKLEVHRAGDLHRAFSILLVNPRCELLLQRRARHKYHFAGRWSNACCGHPRPGEPKSAAARRRLYEELGIRVPLEKTTEFCYRATDPATGLTENEYLHVYTGEFLGEPNPDPGEVGAWRWMSESRLKRAIRRHPDSFTPWFHLLIGRLFPDQ
jgi:isopentenyl-diphosphate delta-isomerase